MKRNRKRIMSLLLIAAMLLTTDMKAAAAELKDSTASGNAVSENAVTVSEDVLSAEEVSADAYVAAGAADITDGQKIDGLEFRLKDGAAATYDSSTSTVTFTKGSIKVYLSRGNNISSNIILNIESGVTVNFDCDGSKVDGSKATIKGSGTIAFEDWSVDISSFTFNGDTTLAYTGRSYMVVEEGISFNILSCGDSMKPANGKVSIYLLCGELSENAAAKIMNIDHEGYKITLLNDNYKYISGNRLYDKNTAIQVRKEPYGQKIFLYNNGSQDKHKCSYYFIKGKADSAHIQSCDLSGTKKGLNTLDFSGTASLGKILNSNFRFALSTNTAADTSKLKWTGGSASLKFTGLQPDTRYFLYAQGIESGYFYTDVEHTTSSVKTKSSTEASQTVSCNYTYVLEYSGRSSTVHKSADVSDSAVTIYPAKDISTSLNGMITNSADQVTGFRFCNAQAEAINGAVMNDGDSNGSRTYMNYKSGASVTFDTDHCTDIHIVPVVSGHVSDGVTLETVAPVEYDGNRHVASDSNAGSGVTDDISIVLKNNGTTLTYGTDYTVTYKNNVNASVKFVLDAAGNTTTEKLNPDDSRKWPMVTVTGKGNYSGLKVSAYFDIYPKKFNTNTLSISHSGQSITGLQQCYTIGKKGGVKYSYKVTYNYRTLKKGRDYDEHLYQLVSGDGTPYYAWKEIKASDIGSDDEDLYMVAITGKGNYYGLLNEVTPDDYDFEYVRTGLGMFVAMNSKQLKGIKFSYKKSIAWKSGVTYKDFDIQSDSGVLNDCTILFYQTGKYSSGKIWYRICVRPSINWETEHKSFGHYDLNVYVETKKLRKSDFHLAWNSTPYDGKAHAQTVTYTGSGTYNVSYYNADKDTLIGSSFNESMPGNYYASVKGTGEYAGSTMKLTFKIAGMNLSQAVKKGYVSIIAQDAPLNINGTITTLTLTDKLAGNTYKINRYSYDDFAVTGWGSNKKAGKTKITVKAAKGMMFTGSATADFVIRPATVTSILSYDAAGYDSSLKADAIYAVVSDVRAVKGKTVTPKVTLYQAQYKWDDNERKYIYFKRALKQGSDYKVDVTTNNAAGNAVTIQNGTSGNFDFGSGAAAPSFGVYDEMAKRISVTLSGDGFNTAKNQAEFTGNHIEPEAEVYVNGAQLDPDSYSVRYEDNVDVGTAKAVIVLKHSSAASDYKYGGTKTVTFRIVRLKSSGLILSMQ